MSDDTLKMDADALDGFTTQLTNLMRYESATMFPASFHGEMGDGGVENAVSDMANTDLAIGQRLNNYLSALAGLTGSSAKATRDMDQQLANAVPPHGKLAQL
jgi:hypothetical protein